MELVLRAEDFIYSLCYGLQEWTLSKSHHIICWSAATLCCGPKSGAATLNKQLAVGSRHSWETGCVRKPVGWHLASGMGRNKSQFTFYFYCYFFFKYWPRTSCMQTDILPLSHTPNPLKLLSKEDLQNTFPFSS